MLVCKGVEEKEGLPGLGVGLDEIYGLHSKVLREMLASW
jgi:hypothetical protein